VESCAVPYSPLTIPCYTGRMRTGYTSTVCTKFQFTLPKAVCNALHLKRGDRILLWEQDGGIVGQPVKTLPSHPRMSFEQAEAALIAFRKAYGKDVATSLLPPDVLDAARHYHLLG
jgi:bifunctional DNA-binding transcriptional regulator/antitoxin component of YhaV-PrlF toxin-antitoxin module